MRSAIYLLTMLAVPALLFPAGPIAAADAPVPVQSVVRECTDPGCRPHERIYTRREYIRVRYPKCRIRDACSLYGAYGPYGGAPYWGAYTGWGNYQVW